MSQEEEEEEERGEGGAAFLASPPAGFARAVQVLARSRFDSRLHPEL